MIMFRFRRLSLITAFAVAVFGSMFIAPSSAFADCPETGCSTIARNILNLTYNGQPRVKFNTYHVSGLGVGDGASAYGNIQDTAAGLQAKTSSYYDPSDGTGGAQYWGSPAKVYLTKTMLNGLYQVGSAYRVTVTELAGGGHSNGSKHFQGRAFDIGTINGVSYGQSGYATLANSVGRMCQNLGAVAYYPAYDPYGGHQNHVHCQW